MSVEKSLKPCPFCGGRPVLMMCDRVVRCPQCDARGPYEHHSPRGRLAVAAWNRRDHRPVTEAYLEGHAEQSPGAVPWCESMELGDWHDSVSYGLLVTE